MGDIEVELVLHHGGTIVQTTQGIQYMGGEITSIGYIDIDMLPYPNMMSYVGDLGYRRVGELYYKKIGWEIVEINDDKELLGVCPNLVHGQILCFIVDCPKYDGNSGIHMGMES